MKLGDAILNFFRIPDQMSSIIVTPVSSCSLAQHEIYLHRIVGKHHTTIPAFNHASIDQGGHVAMNGLDVPPHAAGGCADRHPPGPVIVRSNSQRFWVRTFHSNSGVVKEIRLPSGSPPKAAAKRRSTSACEATPKLTTPQPTRLFICASIAARRSRNRLAFGRSH